MKMKCIIVVLLMSCLTHVFSKLELINNGYEGLYVVIGPEVKENYSLVSKIKSIITDASRLLFTATKHRAYIRNVTIIIPKTWSRSLEGNVISKPSSLDSEYILIDIPSSKYGRDPYVEGVVECGKPGKYMHLTPGLLLMEDAEKAYGPWAHVFVHEWGHLRWGLFDEYKRTINYFNPYFYLDMETEQYQPILCMKNIKGQALMNCNKDKPCDVSKIMDPLPRECRYCLVEEQTTPVSLMGLSYIASVENFCENDNNTAENYRHISAIPSDQNVNCHYKSTWEVIREHNDFQGRNYAASESTDTTPIFNMAYSGAKVRALVLDVSGSMSITVASSGLSRIAEMRQAVQYIIDVLVQDSSHLGIVSFSNSATILAPLREIKNDTDRHILKNVVLSLKAAGGTAIGQGLQNAKKLFEASGMGTKESEIILITDGEETTAPYIANVTDALIEAGIVVHTISISQGAQKNLKDLAQATGGTFLTFLEKQSVTFIDVFSQVIISGDATPDANTPENIATYSKNTLANENYTETFQVDNGLGKDTKLTVASTASSPVLLTVICPDGSNIQSTIISTGTQTILCGDNRASTMAGAYTFILSSHEATYYNVYLTSSPRGSNADVIRVRSWLSDTEIDFAAASTIRLYVDVEKGRSPVLNAKVTGMLIRGDGSSVNLELHDTGKGADLNENDGLYTTYLYKNYFTGNGRYNMKITVSSDEGTVTYSSPSGQRAPTVPGAAEEAQPVMESVEAFMRSIIPNEFVVKNYSSSAPDTSPPNAISDLRIANATINAVLLEFTATGGDYDRGQAQYYEVRTSNSINILINDFDSGILLNTSNIIPKPSGETEQLVFEGSKPGSSENEEIWYVGIRAVDRNDNKGSVSNIVTLGRASSFNITENFTVIAAEKDNIDKQPEDEVNTSNTTIYIVVGVIVVVILVLAVGGLFLYKKLKQSGSIERINYVNSYNVRRNNSEYGTLTQVPLKHDVDTTSHVEETTLRDEEGLAGVGDTTSPLMKEPINV